MTNQPDRCFINTNTHRVPELLIGLASHVTASERFVVKTAGVKERRGFEVTTQRVLSIEDG